MLQDDFINPKRYLFLLIVIVFSIPSIVLMGWFFNIELLKSIFPNMVAMNPTSAVLLILSGFSLYLVQEKKSHQAITIGRYLGLCIAVIALIRLAGFSNTFDIGIDQILFSNKLQGNRTSPNATINFILIGFSLLLIDYRKKNTYFPSQFLALLVFIISLLAIIGYLYSATSLYRLSVYLPMRFHTAITFLLLSLGILLVRSRCGFVSVIMHKNFGGHIARKILPIGIIVPILISFLRLQGQRLNLYDPQFGSALGVLLIISITSILLWMTAKSLNKTDDQRKMAELKLLTTKNELAENEMKYRNIIENAGVVMYTSTINGLITFASSKAVQLTGYSMNELIGMHFSKLVDSEFKARVKINYETQLKESIEETLMEFCIRTKTGNIKCVEQSAVLLIENNLPVGFQCIVKDISAKKEMQEVVRKYEVQLIENQERLQSILDNTTSLIYIKDIEGKYLLTNKKFKEALNVNDETVIGKTDFDFGDPEQAKRFKATDEEVLKTLKQVEQEEVIEMPDGMHTILITKFPLLNSKNEIYGISGIATDISERVKYQEQLVLAKKLAEDAQKLQEQFLANMSHEIRTPMNGIRGMTDLLLETELNAEQKDFTNTIKRSSDNLLVIINDVLDLSKIQAGKLTIEKIDFKLIEILDNIKVMFHHRIAKKGLYLKFTVDSVVPEIIKGDPYRLNQILINLIGNAIKFTNEGGVTVEITNKNQNLKEIILNFKITDTGIGIDSDKLNAIFESFTQANEDTSRIYGGTGLGLSITKQLLKLQGGTILVESKVNIGSTFQFSIPYSYSTSKNSTTFIKKDNKEQQLLLKNKNFLVAEDNDINQKVIRHVLQKAGGKVDVANHGLEAIDFLKKSTDYDIIIMDLQMDEMDGYAATRYIRSVMNLTIPIIAMTATALKGEREKCIEAGMNDYISKPFDFSFLYTRIKLLLNAQPLVEKKEEMEKTSTETLFDLSLLEEMGDNEYIAEVLTIFLNNTPDRLNELRDACKANEFVEVHITAHKLKSSIGLLKADSLLNIMKKIEETGKAEKSDGLVELAELAIKEFKKLEVPLQEHLKNINAGIASGT